MCRYRLIRVRFEPNSVTRFSNGSVELTSPPDLYYIQRSVRCFGFHLWWTLGYPYYFNNNVDALLVMERLCKGVDFESKLRWEAENSV